MSRGTQLSQLRKMLKAEVGSTLTDGVNTADDARFDMLLANKQLELASLYDWPFLRDRKDVATVSGQRFYPLPLLNYERPHRCQVSWSNIWRRLVYGITEQNYNLINSLLTPPSTVDPIARWLIAEQINFASPSCAVTATGAGSGPPAGTYTYAVTYVTPNGETEPGAYKTVTGNGTTITIDSPNPTQQSIQGVNVDTVSYKNIYRTEKDGSILYLLTATPATLTSYNDTSLSDLILGAQAPERNTATMGFFEIWPVCSTAQNIRFTGERLLNPLLQDNDPADLDDLLLVYHCAAEEAVQRESPNASLKLQKAAQRLQFLRASYPAGSSVFIIGSANSYQGRRRIISIAGAASSGSSSDSILNELGSPILDEFGNAILES